VAAAPDKRAAWLRERTDQTLQANALAGLRTAKTSDDAVVALGTRVVKRITETVASAGTLVLRPSEERRRTGSHYTPRSLTEPIVRKTLEPVLRALGDRPTPEQILDLKVCDPAMGSGAFLVEACRQLGDALSVAWHAHDRVPPIPPDEDELLHARRLVAQRGLYGVDKNPMAVDLAKLSLWLATLARDHDFAFVDHALRDGDSLVGLTAGQIEAFDWRTDATPMAYLRTLLAERMRVALTERGGILRAGDIPDDDLALRAHLQDADSALDDIRIVGDLVVSAFFIGANDKDRARFRTALAERVTRHARELRALRTEAGKLSEGEHPVRPFHWQIEFPEVFTRPQPGFDAVVGNPPFAGKNTIAASNREGFRDWLKMVHAGAHGNSDLVAHFYRRAFGLLRPAGCFGLIATNTIGQGDTRATGLRPICQQGGTIYAARKRLKWPGAAAVVVSVVHVCRGALPGPFDLDGHQVPLISAYLFHAGGHDDPVRLTGSARRAFVGSYVLGMGFTFDDTDTSGEASSLSEMQRLIAEDSRNAERIFPYIGGEEVNTSPTHSSHRWVINFGEMTEAEARRWPALLAIVEARVRPRRRDQGSIVNPERWWHHARPASDLYRAADGLDRVLATSRHAPHLAFAFLQAGAVFSEALVVFALPSHAAFCTVQSRLHEVWARFFGSSMKDDLRYSPSDCFETFPLPASFDSAPALEAAGRAYYEFRAELMVRNDEGLTKTYNRFHDPDDRSRDILRLRELHAAMDRAVLDAYGWTNLDPRCEFLLDYEEDDEESSRKKKPWRYRWSDELRDEVLARLLDLNQQLAREEQLAGAKEGTRGARASRPRGQRRAANPAQGSLLS
jgi:hypothetical protein